MKKNLLIATLFFMVGAANAKKVKFSVDMTGQTISANGIHLSGDMQDEAGFPADWEPNTTKLTQEGSSNIYTIILDIPAHRKYEYKFVNGDLFYEVEFVPEQSRVGHDFNDNRWIYVDSTANDTTYIGSLLFGGNAPAGKKLIHFRVNLKYETVSSNGVHLASSLNGWNYENVKLYSFSANVYEYMGYADDNSTVSYQFVNGNTLANAEIVPSTCATSGKRTILAATDVVLDSICFSSCTLCDAGTGINNLENNHLNVTVFPNPAQNEVMVETNYGQQIDEVIISDFTGKTVKNTKYNQLENSVKLTLNDLKSGIYFIQINSNSSHFISKIAIQK